MWNIKLIKGSKDDLFKGFFRLNEHGIIFENDFTNEEKEDENNNIDVKDNEDSLIGSSDMDL